ncbi:MAG: dipeptide epimerase [Ktedonobacterales bacterium]
MELTAQALELKLTEPFRIARSVQYYAHNVLTQIEVDGIVGVGEAAPSGYYGEKRESVLMALSYFTDHLGDDPTLIEDVMAGLDRVMQGNAAAKAAIDMALYDIVGKRLGVPVYQLLGLNPGRAPHTSFTIGMDTPIEMAKRALVARDYPILKIKLGGKHDLDIIKAIRDVTNAVIRVDANAAWTPKEAIRSINALEPYDIEFVEQPLPPKDLAGLRLVRENVSLPIIVDESCVTLEDIPLIIGCADGINIKLMKCGGIHHALKMIHAARAHHLRVMLGCMIESSLAITAAAHLSPLVDYADLDGMLLVDDDPFDGVQVKDGKLMLPDRPGLGVRRRDGKRKLPARAVDATPAALPARTATRAKGAQRDTEGEIEYEE